MKDFVSASSGKKIPTVSPSMASADAPPAIAAGQASFAKGDQVNLKHVVEGHIVASGEVTGIAGEETFHTREIPQPLVRVLVKRVYEDVPLLMPNAEGDQSILSHV
ncbi:unnamed protein product [Calypogeia fissa]